MDKLFNPNQISETESAKNYFAEKFRKQKITKKNKRKKRPDETKVSFICAETKKIEMKVSHQIFVGSQKVIILDRKERKVQRKLKVNFLPKQYNLIRSQNRKYPFLYFSFKFNQKLFSS